MPDSNGRIMAWIRESLQRPTALGGNPEAMGGRPRWRERIQKVYSSGLGYIGGRPNLGQSACDVPTKGNRRKRVAASMEFGSLDPTKEW